MTREQTAALAALIARGAGHALDIARPGDDWQGIADAALEFARTVGWSPPAATAGMRRAAHEHAACRVQLQAARARVDALEIALAGVLGAARVEPPCLDNLVDALETAGDVLAGE